MCHQRSSAIKMIPPSAHLPPLTSSVLFGKAPKNNHPGHAPLLPIIGLIYPHLTLRFSFLLSVFLPFRLPLIVIVFFCPCHYFAFAMSCFLFLLSCSLDPLAFSSSISLLLIPLFCSLPCLFNRLLYSTWQKAVLTQFSAQSSLSDSFILSANNPFNSACLISVCSPHTDSHTHTHSHNL